MTPAKDRPGDGPPARPALSAIGPGLDPNARNTRVGGPGLHPNARGPRVGGPGLLVAAAGIGAGDVVVIPAGTGHLFTKIDDHINYLMVRIDPDKLTPLRDEAKSKAYLAAPAPR